MTSFMNIIMVQTIERRRAKNRISARKSRLKKKVEIDKVRVLNKELEDHIKSLNRKIVQLKEFIIDNVVFKKPTPELYHEETILKEPLDILGCLHQSSSEDDGIPGTTSSSIDLFGFE